MTTAKSETVGTPILRTVALTRRFGSVVAVDSLDLEITSGAIFGLLGPNGAGKSTTIRMLTTLLPPTSGTAVVAGHDIRRDPAGVRRQIGYVPQLLSADGALTGYENLLLSARLYDVPKAEQKPRITEALAFMGLESAARTLVKTYSGGMVRRLELAQATLHHPAILFLDEPTIGLDPIARHAVWERLLESRQQFAMTMLITTHDMEEAEALCDTLAIMHAGRLAALGTPAALKQELGPNATLDDVFVKAAGGEIDQGGGFRDAVNTRRTATRLG
jgi:ABC-2 type transport system ATP-binding protein